MWAIFRCFPNAEIKLVAVLPGIFAAAGVKSTHGITGILRYI